MPITADQKADVLAFLHDQARAAGEPDGLTAQNFERFFFDHWDEITDLRALVNRAKRVELDRLTVERQRQDDDRAGLDAEIDALDAEVNPRTRPTR